MFKRIFVKTVITVIFMTSFLFAQVPQMINYQGYLTDTSGDPIDGPSWFVFSIYDVPTEGIALWTETKIDTVRDGYMNTMLGSVTPVPASLFTGGDLYLGIKVGVDPEMIPRKQFTSVGYAFRATYADSLGSYEFVDDNIKSIDNVKPDNGNVDLVAGSNVTITPNASTHSIKISASGGGSGDNLGNHTATQNIRLNGKWLSGDGDNEGIFIANDGDVTSKKSFSSDQNIYSVQSVVALNGSIVTGVPFTYFDNGDIASSDDLVCDDDLVVRSHAGINRSASSNDYALYVNGSGYATGTWGSSDIKFKKNVKDLKNSLDKIKNLRGTCFNWKINEYPDRGFDEGTHFGLIAQEVEQVIPEVVKTDEEGEKAINYGAIIPVLINAMQEQQKMIEELQSQVDQLMNE